MENQSISPERDGNIPQIFFFFLNAFYDDDVVIFIVDWLSISFTS